jgi:hypothetical protein
VIGGRQGWLPTSGWGAKDQVMVNVLGAYGGWMLRFGCGLLALSVWPDPGLAQQVLLRGAAIETLGPQGRLEVGDVLVEGGVIKAIGDRLPLPERGRVIDLGGRTIMPGLVDPYFVVDVPVGLRGGRSGGQSAVPGDFSTDSGAGSPTTFFKLADGFDPRIGDWGTAVRSGLTSMNLVTRGYGQSLWASPQGAGEGQWTVQIRSADGLLFTQATNQTSGLRVLREGLATPRGASRGRADAAARGAPAAADSAGDSASATPDSSQPASLWQAVRSGSAVAVVNLGNPTATLYALQELGRSQQARLALVASGANAYESLAVKRPERVTWVLSPVWDLVPGSRYRINIPAWLHGQQQSFVLSLSSSQGIYRESQAHPLFPVAMLVKSGLPRQLALESVTLGPAKLLGWESEIGSIEVGKRADVVVFDSDPLEATAAIEQVWVAGEQVY